MMTFTRRLQFRCVAMLFAAVGLATVGCSSVTVKAPFGEPVSGNVTEQMAGAWEFNGQVLHIAAKDEATVRVALVEYKDGQFVLKQFDAAVRELDARRYVFIHEEDADGGYTFGHLVLQARHDHMIVYGPDVKLFEQLVSDGEIAGTNDRNNNAVKVKLDATHAQLEERLSAGDHAKYFNQENPAVLVRIGKK